MKVTLMLADSAQAVGNKLYILGGGWSVTAPNVPHALGLLFQVPWDQSDDRHRFRIELLDSDGQAVTDSSGGAIVVEGEFATGRPPGLKKGTPLDFAVAAGIPPLPLELDQRYEWRLSVNGEQRDDWRLGFSTAPPGQFGMPAS